MKRQKIHRGAAAAAPARRSRALPAWAYPALIVLCVALFYWVPLTSANASIQWDAADMHYPLQKYFSDHLRAGSLPFWAPYVFCGYPLLANTEVAAWYLPHWLFYLLGVTPRAIEWELALNACLACLGAWLFLRGMVRNRAAAVVGAIAYGFSGFFAAYSSHVGIFCAAACFPWLLAAYRRALEGPALRFAALGCFAGGLMILAGYFQTAMYGFLALGLLGVADIRARHERWLRVVGLVALLLAGSLAIAAVLILPGIELTAHSIRGAANYSTSTEGVLHLEPLLTLIAPNWLGALSGAYRGPADITQYYFYGGLLLLPLAALGVARSGSRLAALVIAIPTLWYMAGPAGGFYRVAGLIPGLHRVRAPIQGWFIVALALAMLAAGGAEWLFARWRHPAVAAAVIAILFCDLWYWNSAANPLAYARNSFDDLYGSREASIGRQVAATQPPLTRLDAPRALIAMGPLDHPLDLRLEATYGYFALEPSLVDEYATAMEHNPKLRDGLNVSRYVDTARGALLNNAGVLPRAYFPKTVRDVASPAESLTALGTLDPSEGSVVMGAHPAVRQDPASTATVTASGESFFRVRYHAAAPGILKLSEAWFPGWRATVGGAPAQVLVVDHALMGVAVPAGDGEVVFEFHSTYFGVGLAITLTAALLLGILAAAPFGRETKKVRISVN